jgi:hypothetical protein
MDRSFGKFHYGFVLFIGALLASCDSNDKVNTSVAF